MSIESENDLLGMSRVSEAVAQTLRAMREYAKPGMNTYELDLYGAAILQQFGARPAPQLVYNFPGCACISVNTEVAHGIPSKQTILKEGDLINIDVSAELDGYYADNGGSFILGEDTQNLSPLVEASKDILYKAIYQIKGGVKINEIGRLIETEAKKRGFTVIKNLCGHGVGRSLHEAPHYIANYHDRLNLSRFRKNSVVAIETFISTKATYTHDKGDGWTYITKDGSFVAQHEHTILVTDKEPVILTRDNQIWN
ncbi:type I methionyl aminopeptidase [Mucilaginibacter sp. Bleaf8]|uniref:type I methionyl aminopeptidase n=1 Tax=Mucilaginibacter sp. Bleaf8 TaxID=2834430 RepID=UPI001BCB993C|nr:type I methionyl aminopeptidase [Mucilaginibacter sp. Bleaf8]MBS7565005.1 type I methionyl aminopeptidase [Mucilaginibacter sp. Bleaf8]